ncbi:hypothetical protein [Pusillimonas sp. ANT_WB101]|uniref:hypothetical protein n=1 Tax=Pusillimonas sp. ANT_WB101 TaxID=2597356 RepID=UPI0011EED0BE|nr:hypothetical protein [Pusillimonas sp. ANT_WB101]KAA0889370.1 hypothetical protein FQ179_19620 [Pusillimonas sp. ANT_WB101]
MRAEDILSDDQDQLERGGVVIRKGTVAAFMANARIWCDPGADAAQRQSAERDIRDALPGLRALGVFDVFAVTNADLRRLLETQ